MAFPGCLADRSSDRLDIGYLLPILKGVMRFATLSIIICIAQSAFWRSAQGDALPEFVALQSSTAPAAPGIATTTAPGPSMTAIPSLALSIAAVIPYNATTAPASEPSMLQPPPPPPPPPAQPIIRTRIWNFPLGLYTTYYYPHGTGQGDDSMIRGVVGGPGTMAGGVGLGGGFGLGHPMI